MAHPQGIRCFILACLYLLVQSSLAYGMDVIITTANLNWIAQVSTIQGGDTVTFYPGTYYITQTIQLNLTAPPLFPTKIIGIGATIVSQAGTTIFTLAGSFFEFRDLTLESGDYSFLAYAALSNVNIVNVTMRNARYACIQWQKSQLVTQYVTKITVDSCRFLGCALDGPINSAARTCITLGNPEGTMVVTDFVLKNSILDNCYGHAIRKSGFSTNVTLSNNWFTQYNASDFVLHLDENPLGSSTTVVSNMIVMDDLNNDGVVFGAGTNLFNNIIVTTATATVAGYAMRINSAVTLPYRDILIAHNTVVGRWEAALYLTLLNDTNTANFVLLNNAFLTSNSTSASSINIALFPPGASAPPGNVYTQGINGAAAANVTTLMRLLPTNNLGDIIRLANPIDAVPTNSTLAFSTSDTSSYSLLLAYDFLGNPRNTSSPTSGAVEFSNLPPPPITLPPQFPTMPPATTGIQTTPVASTTASPIACVNISTLVCANGTLVNTQPVTIITDSRISVTTPINITGTLDVQNPNIIITLAGGTPIDVSGNASLRGTLLLNVTGKGISLEKNTEILIGQVGNLTSGFSQVQVVNELCFYGGSFEHDPASGKIGVLLGDPSSGDCSKNKTKIWIIAIVVVAGALVLIGLVVVVLVLAKRRGLFTSLWHQREEEKQHGYHVNL